MKRCFLFMAFLLLSVSCELGHNDLENSVVGDADITVTNVADLNGSNTLDQTLAQAIGADYASYVQAHGNSLKLLGTINQADFQSLKPFAELDLSGVKVVGEICLTNDVLQQGGNAIPCADYLGFNFDNLVKLDLPESITAIGEDAFNGAKKLSVVRIPEAVITIKAGAFLGCDNLTDLRLTASGDETTPVASVAPTSLPVQYTVLNKEKSLSDDTAALSSLSVTVTTANGEDVRDADRGWESYCLQNEKDGVTTAVETHQVASQRGADANTNLDSKLQNMFGADYNSSDKAPVSKIIVTGNINESDVKYLQKFKVVDLSQMRIYADANVADPQGVRADDDDDDDDDAGDVIDIFTDCIKASSWRDNMHIEEIIFPNYIKRIGANAFTGAKNLRIITMPSVTPALEAIEDEAFSFTGVISVEIPASVVELGEKIFDQTEELKRVSLGWEEIPETVNLSSSLASEDSDGNTVCAVPVVVIPDTSDATKFNTALSGLGEQAPTVVNVTAASSMINNDKAGSLKSNIDNVLGADFLTSEQEKIEVSGVVNSADLAILTMVNKIDLSKVTAFEDGKIGESTFKDNSYLKEIILPEITASAGGSLLNIGASAFAGTTNLTTITIPTTVTSIGDNAFAGSAIATVLYEGYDSEGKSYINTPNIGIGAFASTKLTDIQLGTKITAIGADAFNNVATLNTIDALWVESVPSAEATAFPAEYLVGGEKFITIPTNFGGNYIFAGGWDKYNLKDVAGSVIDSSSVYCESAGNLKATLQGALGEAYNTKVWDKISITGKINAADFEAMQCFKAIYLNGVEIAEAMIPASAFKGNTTLATIELPTLYPITSIGASAFEGSAISKLEIPSSVATLGAKALNTSSLSAITVNWDVNSRPATVNKETLPASFLSNGGSNYVTIKEETGAFYLTNIGWEDYNLKDVNGLPIDTSWIVVDAGSSQGGALEAAMVKILGESYATAATPFDKVTIIGNMNDADFKYITNIENLDISQIVVVDTNSIPAKAFASAKGIKSIVLPKSAINIGASAFEGLALSTIDFSKCMALTTIGSKAFSGVAITSLSGLPSTLTSIGDQAFGNNATLASIDLSSATALKSVSGFAGATALTSYKLPAEVVALENAFTGCTKLSGEQDLSSYEKLTTLTAAYNGCTAITSVKLPTTSIITIGKDAFAGATKLVGISNVADVSIASVSGAFDGCSALFTAYFGAADKVVSANSYRGCSSISDVVLPANITSIECGAFDGCTNMKSLTINNISSVVNIDVASDLSDANSLPAIFLDGAKGVIKVPATIMGEYTSAKADSSNAWSKYVSVLINSSAFSSNGITLTITQAEAGELESIGTTGLAGIFKDYGCNKLAIVGAVSDMDMVTLVASGYPFSTLDFSAAEFPNDVITKNLYYNSSKNSNITLLGVAYDDVSAALTSSCGAVTTVILPAKTHVIDLGSFRNLTALNTIENLDYATSVGNYAFESANSLPELIFSDDSQLVTLGQRSFRYTSALKTVVLPKGLTSNGLASASQIFGSAIALEKVTLYCPMVFIAGDFPAASTATYVVNDDWSDANISDFKALFSNADLVVQRESEAPKEDLFTVTESSVNVVSPAAGEIAKSNIATVLAAYTSSTGTLTISGAINAADMEAITKSFATIDLVNATIEGNVIADKAFDSSRDELASLTLPKKGIAIGDSAFDNFVKLVPPTGLDLSTSIGASAFDGCTSFSIFTIGENTTSVASKAFSFNDGMVVTLNAASCTYAADAFGTPAAGASAQFVSITGFTPAGLEAYQDYFVSEIKMIVVSGNTATITTTAAGDISSVMDLAASLGGDEVTTLVIKGAVSDADMFNITMTGHKFEILDFSATEFPSSVIPKALYCNVEAQNATYKAADADTKALMQTAYDAVTKVILPAKAHSIADSAIRNCPNLVVIENLEYATALGNFSLFYASALGKEELDISNVATIGSSAFCNCADFKTIKFSPELTSIGKSAFNKNTSLDKVTLPATITSLGEQKSVGSIFLGCTALTEVTIECAASVDVFGNFGGNFPATTTATFIVPDSEELWTSDDIAKLETACPDATVQRVSGGGNPDYEPTSGFVSVTGSTATITGLTAAGILADNKTAILADINGGDFITTVKFAEASLLSDADLKAISAADALTYVTTYDFTNTTLGYVDGSEQPSLCDGAFEGNEKVHKVTIPSSVASIGANAFAGAGSLEIINLENVGTLGQSSFSGAAKLAAIDLSSASSIGDSSFSGASTLASVELTDKILTEASLGSNAFANCVGLTTVDVHCDATFISENTFAGCNFAAMTFNVLYGTKDSTIDNISGWYSGAQVVREAMVADIFELSGDGSTLTITPTALDQISVLGTDVLLSKFASATTLVINGANSAVSDDDMYAIKETLYPFVTLDYSAAVFANATAELPAGIIPTAFYNLNDNDEQKAMNQAVTSLILPAKAHKISKTSFPRLSKVVNITNLDYVVEIGESAFQFGNSLTHIDFSENALLTTIGPSAFTGAKASGVLQSVTIPSSVTSIGAKAFNTTLNATLKITLNVTEANIAGIDANAFDAPTAGIQIKVGDLLEKYKAASNMATYKDFFVSDFSRPNSDLVTISGNTATLAPTAACTISADKANVIAELNDHTEVNKLIITNVADVTNVDDDDIKALAMGTTLSYITEYDLSGVTLALKKESFKGNTVVTTVVLGDNVKKIYDNVFNGASQLANIDLSNVTNMNVGSMAGTAVTEVTLGSKLAVLDPATFTGCTALKTVNLDGAPVALITAADFSSVTSFVMADGYYTSAERDAVAAQFTNATVNEPAYKVEYLTISGDTATIGSGALPTNAEAIISEINADTNVTKVAFASGSALSGEDLLAISAAGKLTTVTSYDLTNSGLTQIPASAFAGNEVVVEVISTGIDAIGASAFNGCINLTTIDWANVTTFGESSFSGCVNLTKTEFNSSLGYIGGNAFEGVASFHGGYTIPAEVTYIGDYAFDAYESIRITMNIPNASIAQTMFGSDALPFGDPSSVSGLLIKVDGVSNYHVKLPKYTDYFTTRPFQKEYLLTYTTVDDVTTATLPEEKTEGYIDTNIAAIKEELNDGDNKATVFAFAGNTLSEADLLALGGGGSGAPFTKITKFDFSAATFDGNDMAPNAFNGNTVITDVVLPTTCTKLCNYAFQGCTNLANINLGDVTSIALSKGIFKDTALATVDLSKVKTISSGAFAGTKLTEVTITTTTTTTPTDESVFAGCDLLTTATIESTSLSAAMINVMFIGCDNLGTLTLPDGVYSQSIIDLFKMSYPSAAASITCTPKSEYTVTVAADGVATVVADDAGTIASDANFETNIDGATKIVFEGSLNDDDVKKLGDLANIEIFDLSKAIISGGTIVANAFSSNTVVTEVELPQTVTTIDEYAFKGATNLTTINLSNVIVFGDNSFDSTKLNSVDLSAATTIGKYAFFCSNLASVVIPANVESVGASVFAGCALMTSATVYTHCIEVEGYKGLFADNTGLIITLPSGKFTTAEIAQIDDYYSITRIEGEATDGVITTLTVSAADEITAEKLSSIYNSQSNESEKKLVINSSDPDNKVTLSDADMNLIGATLFKSIDLSGVKGALTSCMFVGGGADATVAGTNTTLTSIALPSDTAGAIANCALANCTSLATVTNTSAITSVGSYGFYGCTSLTHDPGVTFPILTSIGMNSYVGTGVTEFTAPSTFTEVKYNAFTDIVMTLDFSGCILFESMKIKSSWYGVGTVMYIPAGTYKVTKPYMSAETTSGSNVYFSEIYDDIWSIYEKDGATETLMNEKPVVPTGPVLVDLSSATNGGALETTLSSLTYNDNLDIDGCMSAADFEYLVTLCKGTIKRVDLSDVTIVGDVCYTTNNKKEETVVTCSTEAQYLPINAFAKATSLEKLILPNGLTHLGRTAISGTNSLKTLILPSKVAHAAYTALYGSLTDLYITSESATVIVCDGQYPLGTESKLPASLTMHFQNQVALDAYKEVIDGDKSNVNEWGSLTGKVTYEVYSELPVL